MQPDPQPPTLTSLDAECCQPDTSGPRRLPRGSRGCPRLGRVGAAKRLARGRRGRLAPPLDVSLLVQNEHPGRGLPVRLEPAGRVACQVEGTGGRARPSGRVTVMVGVVSYRYICSIKRGGKMRGQPASNVAQSATLRCASTTRSLVPELEDVCTSSMVTPRSVDPEGVAGMLVSTGCP